MKKFVILLLAVILCISGSACHQQADSDEEPLKPSASAAEGSKETADENASPYQPVHTAYFGILGEHKLYHYYLTCIYRARIDEFVKVQHDYDDQWSMQEYFDFTAKILEGTDAATGKTNRELLQEQAIQECMYMVVLYNEALMKGIGISDSTREHLAAWWKRYANQYYNRLHGLFPYVQDLDTAIEFMCGGNLNEVIDYMSVQTVVSQYAANRFYNDSGENRDFAGYYQEHLNDFREVTVRAVYIKDKAQANTVRRLMNEKPEYIANLAKAYNEDAKLAKTNGIVTVTAKTHMVPEEVKEWAYQQTPETIFYHHGNIELLETAQGCYLLMCENIAEYQDDEEGNEIYNAVGEAYKKEQLDLYLDELLTQDAYQLTEYDHDQAVKAMDESFKI